MGALVPGVKKLGDCCLRRPMICQFVVLWYPSSFFLSPSSFSYSEHLEDRNCLAFYLQFWKHHVAGYVPNMEPSLPHLIPSKSNRGKHCQHHFTDNKLRIWQVKELMPGDVTSKWYSWDLDIYLIIKATPPPHDQSALILNPCSL